MGLSTIIKYTYVFSLTPAETVFTYLPPTYLPNLSDFVCLFFCLSDFLSVCLILCLSVRLSVSLSVFLSVSLSDSLSV